MTLKEFYNYRFSIDTEVNIQGEWFKLKEIDFMHARVMVVGQIGVNYHCTEIEDIRG